MVSPLRSFQRSDWAGLYDWLVENAEVERHRLHCFVRSGPSGVFGKWPLEYRRHTGSCNLNCSDDVLFLRDGISRLR